VRRVGHGAKADVRGAEVGEHHDGAVLADIDDDGDLDILSIGWSHGRVLLYENGIIDEAAARSRDRAVVEIGPTQDGGRR